MLWWTSWSFSKKGDRYYRNPSYGNTLDQFLNQKNITFPSIIVFVLQQKFTQKWIFAVNLLTLRPFKMQVTESTVLGDS